MSARRTAAGLIVLALLGSGSSCRCDPEPPEPIATVPVRPRPEPAATPTAPEPDLCEGVAMRIRNANDLIHSPSPDPDRALSIYDEVLAAGCTLAPADDWAVREGTGIAQMMKGNWPRARIALEDASRRWPRSATTRYNLACALCRTGDLEGCYQELTAALDNAGPSGAQEFLADQQRTRADFATLARSDPDLALLRADPRFERMVGTP